MNREIEILLVEDDPNDVKLALHAFGKNNLANRVRVLRDGAEALEHLFPSDGSAAPIPKVILLDLELPPVDGIEVRRRIKSDPATRFIPAIVLTSSNQDRDTDECYAFGVNGGIQKPVDFERFVEVVRQLGLYWLLINTLPNSGD